MAYTLQAKKQQQITLSAAEADKLFSCGNSDAALMYLYILRREGRAEDEEVLRALHFSKERRSAAEEALRRLGLIDGPVTVAEPSPETRPNYTQQDIAEMAERCPEYRELEANVAKQLNKTALTGRESEALLGLYEYLSMPVDVICVLVQHCIERYEQRYGVGRRPTMRQIEKEGYLWHQRHLDSTRAASSYLKTYRKRQGLYPKYMEILQLGARSPAPGEEKYLAEWLEMGFSPEAVALAYDTTMLRCHELKWGYLTAILRRWHKEGVHTVAEIEESQRHRSGSRKTGAQKTESRDEYNRKMQDIIREMYKD